VYVFIYFIFEEHSLCAFIIAFAFAFNDNYISISFMQQYVHSSMIT